jgi:GDPmannose 4,6-dehydratase
MKKTAIITGITGQDGAYLSHLLLQNHYKVVGLVRSNKRASLTGLAYLGIEKDVQLEECDLTDMPQLIRLLRTHEPTVVYNLAAQSSVSLSFQQPVGTLNFNIASVLNLLEAIRLTNPNIRFYQASSSEMFGRVQHLPVSEQTPLHPLSPYAISKATAHWMAINYREAYGLFTCCGILFNHDSYLRQSSFFTKKVIQDAISIKYQGKKQLEVGNIEVRRDFGFAPKYVEAMYLMMTQDKAADYLICSGQSVLLRDIIGHVFQRLGIPLSKIVVNPAFYRPTDIEDMFGCPDKAREELNWHYDLSYFEALDMMLEEELYNSKLTGIVPISYPKKPREKLSNNPAPFLKTSQD